MTPKEKAEEIFKRMYKLDSRAWYDIAKQCALIAVNEILDALEEHRWQNRLIMDFYEEVKQEIEQL